jgi:hypothetical protein
MDYRIKKVGDEWEFLPKKERDEKREYERLLNNINKREKKIISDQEKIKTLKSELKEMKIKRTKGYHTMVKYHKELIPTFSISISKNPKYKSSDNLHGDFKTSGNRSWTISVRVIGKRKPIYLGTQQKVGEMFDKIEGRLEEWEKLVPHTRRDHEEKMIKKIDKEICPLIKRDMKEILKTHDSLEPFFDTKIQGMKYLEELYKNSEYYEEPKVKVKEESKGFFLGFDSNGKPIYGKKKSKKK